MSRFDYTRRRGKTIKGDPAAPGYDSIVSYSRDLTYYPLCVMKDLVEAAHNLYNLEVKMFDDLYLLKIITYGELQKNYRDFNQ